MSNQYLSFDVTKQSSNQQLVVGRQGDGHLKFVTILFWDGNKNIPYDLTSKTIIFEALKPDDTVVIDENVNIIDAQKGLARYPFDPRVFGTTGTLKQAFFKITSKDGNGNQIADSTLELSIKVLSNDIENGIESESYLSKYDELIAAVEQKFDDYSATVQDSIDKAQEIHNQIIEYTNLINSSAVITKAEFGDISLIKQPMGVTAVDKLNNEFSQRGVNVKWYGAKGDGVTDDTAAIQTAIDSLGDGDTLIFEQGREYSVVGIMIADKSHLTINGNDSVIKMIGMINTFAFQYSGNVDHLDISGFKIDGTNALGRTTGVGGYSGAHITHSKVHHMYMTGVNVGVTLNADGEGTADYNDVYLNEFQDIKSVDVAHDTPDGYGIHLSGANYNRIFNNRIDRAQRHSLYLAHGDNNDFFGNFISNHRAGVARDLFRPAFNFARDSNNNRVFNNRFENSTDSDMQIATINERGDMSNNEVFGNYFIKPKNLTSVRIGMDLAQDATLEYNLDNLYFHDNTFIIDNNSLAAILLSFGKNVELSGNRFIYSNISENTRALIISPTFSNAVDNINEHDNHFYVSGTNVSEFKAVAFQGLAPTDASIHIQAHHDNFNNLFGDTALNYHGYFGSALITNPNLSYSYDRTFTKNNVAPTSGYHIAGDVVWASLPNSLEAAGWICIAEGAPGVWKKFGAIF